jgi:hypothetical protein
MTKKKELNTNKSKIKMKLLTTICALSLSYLLSAQSRVGSSAADIKAEFWEAEYKLKAEYDKDGDYFISIETQRATVLYYFNENKICKATFIVPDNQGALNFYVELYNKRYVILSPTQWKMYSENGVAEISLIYPEGGGCYFLWR